MACSSSGHCRAKHSTDMVSTLYLSQQAPSILDRRLTSKSSVQPLTIPGCEHLEEQETVEKLFVACLQTGDDKSALLCFEHLTQCFGLSNERVTGLRGLYEEAIAEDDTGLENCLQKYNKLLQENPVNVPILKRRVALLRSMSRIADAIAALIEFIDAIPTDAEAWCELADLYQSQGMSSQAIFCLEEALLIAPNAWNILAQLGEVLYITASSQEAETARKLLGRSISLFCRSIELCDDYLRGFYGLVLVSSTLLNSSDGPLHNSFNASVGDTPSKDHLKRLHAFARKKLWDILKSRLSLSQQEYGCSEGDLIAARELLDRLGDSK
ncbi:hypothetical protein PHISCL_08778 [Aspergillus sclerotialis]|uniref:ER membrane protein complex subunit 2 n=1 Tax=Aspergillus sclerotialis TaxID=2070753 RepID=A0A3A2Z7M3_9EURO|nr:hypothetical protein PHISCL_08778 [Aspergillus sclerotialis]